MLWQSTPLSSSPISARFSLIFRAISGSGDGSSLHSYLCLQSYSRIHYNEYIYKSYSRTYMFSNLDIHEEKPIIFKTGLDKTSLFDLFEFLLLQISLSSSHTSSSFGRHPLKVSVFEVLKSNENFSSSELLPFCIQASFPVDVNFGLPGVSILEEVGVCQIEASFAVFLLFRGHQAFRKYRCATWQPSHIFVISLSSALKAFCVKFESLHFLNHLQKT